MRQGLRSHLTYANVMATIAVFLVLSGGTAVALSGSNTVFTDDIVDNEVRTADVRNDTLSGGGLAGGDLRPNSVGSSEVATDSLGLGDLAPNSVASGEVVGQSLTGFDISDSSITTADIDPTNLNADQLDGFNSTDFVSNTGGTISGALTVGGELVVGSQLRLPVHVSAPDAGECDGSPAEELGRIFLRNDATTTLYICTTTGWVGK